VLRNVRCLDKASGVCHALSGWQERFEMWTNFNADKRVIKILSMDGKTMTFRDETYGGGNTHTSAQDIFSSTAP
jgi:hypothetical protein